MKIPSRITWLSLAVAALVIPLRVWGANAQQMDQSMQLQLGAGEIARQYVRPLGLSGKSMRVALDTFLSQGFSCGVNAGVEKGLPPPFDDLPPFLSCTKKNAGLNDKCDEVTLSVVPLTAPGTDRSLIDRLDPTLVEGINVSCPVKITVSQERYESLSKSRADASHALLAQVEQLNLKGKNAFDVFKEFALKDHDCGYVLEQSDDPSRASGTLTCISWRSGITNCVRARIEFALNIKRQSKKLRDPTRRMEGSLVGKVHATCELPDPEGREE